MKKTKNKKKLLPLGEAIKLNNRAFAAIYKRYPQMIISRVISIVWSSLTPYVGIYLSALLIEELAGAKNPDRLTVLVLLTLTTESVISLISALLGKWKNTQSSGIWYKLERIFTEKLLDMDFASIDDVRVHKLLSTIKQNRNSAGWGLDRVGENYEDLLSAIFTLLGGFALTVSLFISRVPESGEHYTILNNPLFILLVVAVMLAVTYIAPALSNKAGSYWTLNVEDHKMSNRLFGFFGFLGYKKELAADVRIYRQDLVCKDDGKKDGIFDSCGLFARYGRGPVGLYNAASAAVSVIFTGIAYAFVCLKAIGGAFGIGMVTQYIASITKVSGSIAAVVWNIGAMRNNASFLKPFFGFLDTPNDMYMGSLTVEKRRDRDYEIEFKNVSFKYPSSNTYALHNVNLRFKVGQRLAVVGSNGSGKTTFIKLLCRLYDPTEGEILLNGIDIRKYNYLEYMGIFSVVFQDFRLFALKLGENVAAKARYDTALAAECLENAGFGERLAELKHGTETYIYNEYNKDGINISGGEAQKIAIARALYKDAPFIILDEPTAALDPVAEAEIYSKFNDIAGDKTAIYISHRLASCRFCDEIAVFDGGDVIQKGTHDELVSDESGKYFVLWNAQAQYYNE